MHDSIANLLQTWTSFYANHAIVRTFIAFFHIGGLVIGGGCAISADRAVLRVSRRTAEDRAAELQTVHNAHRIVLLGLAVITGSGLLLLAADTDTLLRSAVFWLKMGLILLLLSNGFLLMRAARQAQSGTSAAWRTLTITSTISMALWLLITLAGAALPNLS